MRREWTILVDAREKRPLPFPAHFPVWDDTSTALEPRKVTVRINVKPAHLLTGDYALEGFEHACLIERKASLDELSTNLLTPVGRRRFVDCLRRLRDSCAHPALLLEGTPLTLRSVQRPGSDAVLARDALLRACLEHTVTVHLLPSASAPNRAAAGEWAASMLIAGALQWPHPLPPSSTRSVPMTPPSDPSSLPTAAPSSC